MESEESKPVCLEEPKRSPLQMPRVLSHLVELPIVKSACEQVSDMYERTKEKSLVSMVGFSAAEVSLKAVLVAAKVTYTALPSSGMVGKLKDSFEEKGKPLCNSSKILINFKTHFSFNKSMP